MVSALAFVGGVVDSAVSHRVHLIPSILLFLRKYSGFGPLAASGGVGRCTTRGVVMSAVLHSSRCC